jgi:hypothetical protein
MISPQFRAILNDGDATRERPLQIYGNDLAEIRRWASVVLETALPGAGVDVYQSVEQHVELIPKKQESKK